MKLLVAGFPRDALERLSEELRAAGHQVLGASGKTAAQTFARVTTVEAIIVPEGALGDAAIAWFEDCALPIERRPLPTGSEPEPEPTPEPEPEVLPPEPEPEPEILPPEAFAPAPATTPVVTRATPAEAGPRVPEMRAKLAQVRFSDYLSVLEVPPGASSFEVRDKYRQMSHLYSPQGWPGPLSPEDVEVLDEIARGLRDAFAIMGDDTLRGRYIDALTSASARARATRGGG